MRPYKVLHEEDSHFVVQDEKGTFKVAKPHLHHGTVERIRKYAKGGEVEDPGPETGGEIPPDPSIWDRLSGASMPGGALPSMADLQQVVGVPPAAAAVDTTAQTPPGGVPPGAVRPADALPDGTPAPVIPQAALAPQPTQSLGGMPGAAGQIGVAGQRAMEALGKVGAAQAAGYQNMADIQQKGLDAHQAMIEQGQAMVNQRMRGQLDMFNQISAQKIDPQQFWHSKSTGQKIGSIIGILVSGLGAGRGPNFALDQIDKAIDRDIDAQKTNLQSQHTLLGQYMQGTRDLVSAQHMLRADAMTNVAGQIQVAMSRMQGSTAIPQMQATQQELQIKILGEEQAAQTRTQQVQMGNIQLQSSKFQMQAMGEFLKGGASGGGTRMDPRAFTFLPQPIQDKIVPLADGSYTTARTKEDASLVNKTHEAAATLRAKLQRYSDLLAEHPHGISQLAAPNDYAAAQALHDDMLTDINTLAGQQRFTHEEAQTYSGRIPDITSKQWSQGFQAKIKGLGDDIENKVWSHNKQYLNIRPSKSPAQMRKAGQPGG